MQSIKEFKTVLRRYMENIAVKVDETMPETGVFEKFSFYFYVPCETIREFQFFFEVDEAEPQKRRRVSAGACFPEDDRLMSVYLFTGTKKEILRYLRQPGIEDEVWETIAHLDESIRMHD